MWTNGLLYLELSHNRGVIFLILGLPSLKFESAAEISESLELLNLFKLTVKDLQTNTRTETKSYFIYCDLSS